MKQPLLCLFTAICLSSSADAAASALDCPEPAPLLAEADAKAFDLSKLAQTVGTAELNGQSLGKAVQRIRADYSEAADADVADIMITAFCTYLNTDVPRDHRSEANVNAFEQAA